MAQSAGGALWVMVGETPGYCQSGSFVERRRSL